MSFLQPLLLWALPLAALPVIIHLISRRRHRVLHWAAMMFLLDARRAAKGLARIRQWLILALRVLAVLLLVLAVSRPLITSGTFRFGGGLDAVIIVLDRSASMEQTGVSGIPKREEGLRRMQEYLRRVGRVRRVILLDSATGEPLDIEMPESLLRLPQTQAAAASADIPQLLQQVLDLIEADQIGSAEVWIVSDLQTGDWDPASGRWSELRQQFSARDHIGLRLLAFDEPPKNNLAVYVDQARMENAGRGDRELRIDLRIRRTGEAKVGERIPVEIVVEGARTRYPVALTGRETIVSGVVLPVDGELEQGWGYAEIPGDDRPGDNRSYFCFAPPAPRRTVIVAENSVVGEFWRQVATVPNDPSVEHAALVLRPDQTEDIPWEETAVLVWQAAVPQPAVVAKIEDHLLQGRVLLVLPPEGSSEGGALLGIRWTEWLTVDSQTEDGRVAQWQTKSGLLANDRTGEPLPVNELRVRRVRRTSPGSLVAARLGNGTPLLFRPATSIGTQAWFLATWPHVEYSNLGQERIVAYVMLHRALQRASAQLSNARGVVAGSSAAEMVNDAKRLHPPLHVASLPSSHLAGVYRQGDRMWTLNRPEAEDVINSVPDSRLHELFAGCRFSVIHNRIDDDVSLAREVWRIALVGMLLALLLEAALSLPPRRETSALAQPVRTQVGNREVA